LPDVPEFGNMPPTHTPCFFCRGCATHSTLACARTMYNNPALLLATRSNPTHSHRTLRTLCAPHARECLPLPAAHSASFPANATCLTHENLGATPPDHFARDFRLIEFPILCTSDSWKSDCQSHPICADFVFGVAPYDSESAGRVDTTTYPQLQRTYSAGSPATRATRTHERPRPLG